MTAFSARLAGLSPPTSNIKDGPRPRLTAENLAHFSPEAQAEREAARWELEGFEIAGQDQWTYTWDGDFPVIKLRRGLIVKGWDIRFGIIAEYDGSDTHTQEFFANNTHPANVRSRLDDMIKSKLERPASSQAKMRQSTQAVQELAARHGIPVTVADEIMLERAF